MKIRAVLLILAATLVVTGCAALKDFFGRLGGAAPCTDPVCHVTVTVVNCRIVNPGDTAIGPGIHRIVWKLDSSSHDFTATGIKFEQGEGRIFTSPSHTSQGVFTWVDNNTGGDTRGKFKYTIALQGVGSGACTIDPLDPDLYNN
jgi:hypothetical protein